MARAAFVSLVGLAAQPVWANAAVADPRAAATDSRVELSTLLLPSGASPEPARAAVTFGRGQDIVGVPVDFARMPKPAALAGASRSARGLPAFAAMPTRLPLTGAYLTSGYGMRWHPIRGGYRSHSGIDLAAPAGSPIYAPAPGIVSAAGWDGGYGISVMIEHGGGLQTRYGHMSRLAVVPGQAVAAGTVIGYVGSTGLSTGPHLHYEIRSNGQAVNPLAARR